MIYESRLELARLLYADFDRDVTEILAQPFLLRAEVDGALRRHIPDYLLATGKGPLVVDVKPRHRVVRPEHGIPRSVLIDATALEGPMRSAASPWTPTAVCPAMSGTASGRSR